VWTLWLPRGKDDFYMSSDSPNWHDYMEQNVWPLVADRAVRLNWSERNDWKSFSLATKVARQYARGSNFNPLVVVFRPLRTRQEFRFYYAFRRLKKVGPYELEALVSDLKRILRSESLPPIRNLTD
jgi:hypothetical protein